MGEYTKLKDKILVRCNRCEREFKMLPHDVLKGHGCRKCANEDLRSLYTITQEHFEERVKEINPDIEVLGKYVNNNTPILLRCKKCGYKFEMLPHNIHVRGIRCYNCVNTRNRKEHEDFVK